MLVLFELWADDAFEHDLGAVGLGQEQPDEEEETDELPVGDGAPEDEAKERLDDVAAPEDHPVSEPLLIVILSLRLDCSDGEYHRVENCE